MVKVTETFLPGTTPLVIPPSTNKNCLVYFEDIVLVLIETLKHILISPALNTNDADTSV